MKSSNLRVWPIASLLFVAACGGSESATDGAFPAEPLVTLASVSGKLHIEVRTSPEQPPTRGESSVELVVRDAAGAPSPGLRLAMTPWMPAMGHGTSINPESSESSPGVYLMTQVELFMPGTWELRTDISGPLSDSVAPSLEIE